jgi:hypothetical protein
MLSGVIERDRGRRDCDIPNVILAYLLRMDAAGANAVSLARALQNPHSPQGLARGIGSTSQGKIAMMFSSPKLRLTSTMFCRSKKKEYPAMTKFTHTRWAAAE